MKAMLFVAALLPVVTRAGCSTSTSLYTTCYETHGYSKCHTIALLPTGTGVPSGSITPTPTTIVPVTATHCYTHSREVMCETYTYTEVPASSVIRSSPINITSVSPTPREPKVTLTFAPPVPNTIISKRSLPVSRPSRLPTSYWPSINSTTTHTRAPSQLPTSYWSSINSTTTHTRAPSQLPSSYWPTTSGYGGNPATTLTNLESFPIITSTLPSKTSGSAPILTNPQLSIAISTPYWTNTSSIVPTSSYPILTNPLRSSFSTASRPSTFTTSFVTHPHGPVHSNCSMSTKSASGYLLLIKPSHSTAMVV